MGLVVPASAVSPVFTSNDPYPDYIAVYGLPYADLAPTAAGPVRYPWVRWSHGVLVEEATTNLVLNPAPATTTNYSGTSGTLALDSSFGMTRTTSLTLTATAIPGSVSFAYATTVAATHYTFSVYCYSTRPVTLQLFIDWKNSAGSAISTSSGGTFTLYPGVWQRLIYADVTAPALAVRAHPRVGAVSPSVIGDKFWAANWQVEAKSHATSYTEGAIATGYTWSGTADNSSSLRAASSLSYTLAVPIVPNNGLTICTWISDFTAGGYAISRIAEYARLTAGADALMLNFTNSGQDFYVSTATGSIVLATNTALDSPAFLAATVSGTTLRGFMYQVPTDPDPTLDVGVVTSTFTITALSSNVTAVAIGSGGGAGYEANSPVEQVRVYNAALDVGELEFLARNSQPGTFLDDSRCVFQAASGTDIMVNNAHALAASGSYQALGAFPGRVELTSDLANILTVAQEAYTYRVALPLGTGGFGVGSRIEIRGDGTLHAIGAKASSGTEDYVFFD